MDRPELKRHNISLRYGISPDSEVHNYVPTISQDEDNKIREWVNENYALYSDTYKESAYRDAQKAVLDRKAKTEKKAILEKERRQRAEKAAYLGDDPRLNQEKQAAAAENAISEAAELIRQGQELNGIKVDKTLTDRETINKFMDANTEQPFAEYVNKFLDAQTGKSRDNKSTYDNRRLAAKLGLLGGMEGKLINAGDKLRAGTQGFMQGAANLAQNTLGAFNNWVGSNVAAGLGELGYGVADLLGADVSEGTAWDKMKQAKGYNRAEAKKMASSKDLMQKGILKEDEGAYNIGETLGELATDVALTAPAEGLVAGRIGASTLPKTAKTALEALNLAGGGASFQLADDAAKGELSDLTQYAKTAGINVATAGLFNAINKLVKGGKNVGFTLFGPKGQDRTAIFTQTPEQRAKKTEINKAYAKNKNAIDTPYTEIANDLEKTAEETLGGRLEKGGKLGDVRAFDLQFKQGGRYDAKTALKTDINDALMQLASKKRFGNLAGNKELIPQFKFTKNGLEVSNPDVMNNIYREETSAGGGTKLVKLWDEVKNVYAQTYGGGAKVNAATTEEFLRGLDRVFSKKGWVGGPNNLTALMKEGIDNATKKFENSLTEKSLADLQKARAASESAIKTDENLNKLLGTLRNSDTVGKVGAAEKALGGKASMEQLFKEINEKYGIDMNNEILSWAYNMSLYDVKKAEDLLSTFYPSEPGMRELALRYLTKRLRRGQANKAVELGEEGVKAMGKTSQVPGIVGGEIGTAISTKTND